jgi:hypothetical protein
LLLLALSGAAAASVVEPSTSTKEYASPAACERALQAHHAAAVAEQASAAPGRRDRLSIEPPHRRDGDLLYWTVYDGSLKLPDALIEAEATDEYRCIGRTFEHKAYNTGGAITLLPPPPAPQP